MRFFDDLERNGFSVVREVVDRQTISELLSDIQKLQLDSPAGVRDLAVKVPNVRRLAQSSAIRALVEPVLGSQARLVRSILFNKNTESNWQVAWHQDLSIAVQAKSNLEGFSSWTMKEGVHHVQPPARILENMLSVRLHLDDTDKSNGALWLSPGSHRLGRLPSAEAAYVAEQTGKYLCEVSAGDALLFRPLTLHASRKADSSRPRRVIHLEYAGMRLPDPLKWAEATT